MRNWNNGDNWNFSRWLKNASRNAKANLSSNGLPKEEISHYRSVINYFCRIDKNSKDGVYVVGGTRPWLYQDLLEKSISVSTDYSFNLEVEPDYVIVRAIEIIAKDIISIPLSEEEINYLKTLDFIPAFGTSHENGGPMHRVFGSRLGFGGVVGSRKTTGQSNLKTYIEFYDGSRDWFDFVEEINHQTMISAGLCDNSGWLKIPVRVDIGRNINIVRNNAFSECHSLAALAIPNSVIAIGENAFTGCNALVSLEIPNSVQTIGGYAFANCGALISLKIPDSVIIIRNNAFYGCSSLTSLIIPNSVTTIGGYAFAECTGLITLVISNSVLSIESYAFYGCSSLQSLDIPNAVTTIKEYAFANCTGLVSLTISKSVMAIEQNAFANCSSLKSVIVEGKNIETVQGMNYLEWGLPNECEIRCKDGIIIV